MTFSAAPRSVSDATRFTPTTPHATSKPSVFASPASAATAGSSATAGRSRFAPSGGSRRAGPGGGPQGPGGGGSVGGGGGGGGRLLPGGPAGETMEQRVARLRAAHLAAKNADVSRFDRVVSTSRRFFDSVHKVTVTSLLGLTAIAGLLTVYTAADMISHNRKRKTEFIEAQHRMEADSLAAARLAYMRGDATQEQILLVDEANERAIAAESSQAGFKVPSILGAPAPAPPPTSTAAVAEPQTESPGVVVAAAAEEEKKSGGGISAWFFASPSKTDERVAEAATGNVTGAVEAQAKAAFEQEKTATAAAAGSQDQEKPKKGWW